MSYLYMNVIVFVTIFLVLYGDLLGYPQSVEDHLRPQRLDRVYYCPVQVKTWLSLFNNRLNKMRLVDRQERSIHLVYNLLKRYKQTANRQRMLLHLSILCDPQAKGHKEQIGGATFSDDSRFACTFSEDCTLNVWSVPDGQLVAFYLADCQITTAKFLLRQDNSILGLAAGDVNGLLHFMDIPKDLHKEQEIQQQTQ
eukprot:TRINITY_DN84073_c0_g1_i1.p1 TRINITY_DN84073_c0_g1~~TRINITY_DN84073_c0_g1_i1.p1  ORF type:complete len:197 (+),score=-10.75 TRINITY_DN84073_c0_g1_i1:393-983(+)